MKLVNQSYEILGTPQSLEEAWSFVAKAARNCYQSEKTRLDESEEDFCRRILLKHPEDLECDHMSPFEFGVVYLKLPAIKFPDGSYGNNTEKYKNNPYSRINDITFNQGYICITTNLRVIIENGWEDDLKYAGSPTEHHVKACCFHMITSLHVYKDLTRHRTLSWAIESTRFCRYTNPKFGSGLTFIRPSRLNKYSNEELELSENGYFNESKFMNNIESKPREAALILTGLQSDEYTYTHLINECGWTAQEAATKLPQDTKASVYMCGYEDNLHHMFRLRAEDCSGPVLPQVAELMKPLYNDYKSFNL